MANPRSISLLIGIAVGCTAVTAIIYWHAIAPLADVQHWLFGR